MFFAVERGEDAVSWLGGRGREMDKGVVNHSLQIGVIILLSGRARCE